MSRYFNQRATRPPSRHRPEPIRMAACLPHPQRPSSFQQDRHYYDQREADYLRTQRRTPSPSLSSAHSIPHSPLSPMSPSSPRPLLPSRPIRDERSPSPIARLPPSETFSRRSRTTTSRSPPPPPPPPLSSSSFSWRSRREPDRCPPRRCYGPVRVYDNVPPPPPRRGYHQRRVRQRRSPCRQPRYNRTSSISAPASPSPIIHQDLRSKPTAAATTATAAITTTTTTTTNTVAASTTSSTQTSATTTTTTATVTSAAVPVTVKSRVADSDNFEIEVNYEEEELISDTAAPSPIATATNQIQSVIFTPCEQIVSWNGIIHE